MTFEDLIEEVREKIKEDENITEEEIFAYMMFSEPFGEPIGS